MSGEKIGILGGTFDPIHGGHIRAARAAREMLGLGRVLLVPGARPPHKDTGPFASAEDRLEMVRIATRHEAGLEACDLELRRGGESYTLLLLKDLAREYPDAHRTFLLGIDAYLEIASWHRLGDVLPLADWAILRRPGWHLPSLVEPLREWGTGFVGDDRRAIVRASPKTRIFYVLIPEHDISSTHVREIIAQGGDTSAALHADVRAFIDERGLYRSRSEGN